MWAHSMTVQDYEDLLNRGWRRYLMHIAVALNINKLQYEKVYHWTYITKHVYIIFVPLNPTFIM